MDYSLAKWHMERLDAEADMAQHLIRQAQNLPPSLSPASFSRHCDQIAATIDRMAATLAEARASVSPTLRVVP